MNEEIKIILDTEVKESGKKILDLVSDYGALNSALIKAAVGTKAFSLNHKQLEAGTARMSVSMKEAAVAVTQSTAKMKTFTTTVTGDMEHGAEKVQGFTAAIKGSATAVTNFARAEAILGTNAASSIASLDKRSAALTKLIAKQQEHAAIKKKTPSDKEELLGINQKVITSANKYYAELAKVKDMISGISATTTTLATGGDKAVKMFESLGTSVGATTKVVSALDNEIAAIQGRLSKPQTVSEKAFDTAKLLDYTRAREQALTSVNKLAAAEEAAAAKIVAAENAIATAAEKAANKINTAKTKAAAAAAKAAEKDKSAGYTGIFGQRIGSGDAGLLANLSRMGVVSPQMAQLSYVLQAVTSTGMLAALAITGVGIAGVAAARKVIATAGELQKYRVTMQALATHGWDKNDTSQMATQNLGKAASGDMKEYAASSVYTMEKIAEGTEKLVGYGFDMRTVNTELRMLGDLALGDSARLDNLAIAYGQVFGQGKARAQEMYQFINAGIPMFEELAKKMNRDNEAAAAKAGTLNKLATVTTADVMEMTKKGEMSFERIRDLLKELTAEGSRYHDTMYKISQLSYLGQLNMFKNQVMLLEENIGSTLLPMVLKLLVQVNGLLDRSRKGSTQKEITGRLEGVRAGTYTSSDAALGDITSAALDQRIAGYAKLAKYDKMWGADGRRLITSKTTEDAGYTDEIIQEALKEWMGMLKMPEMRGGQSSAEMEKWRGQVRDAVTAGLQIGLTQGDALGALYATSYSHATPEQRKQFTDPESLILGMKPKRSTMSDRMMWNALDPYAGIPDKNKNVIMLSQNKQLTMKAHVLKSAQEVYTGVNDTATEQAYIRAEAARRVIPDSLSGAGQKADDADGSKRQFELDKYISSTTDLIEQQLQLNTFTKEYVTILQMGRRDMAPVGEGESLKAGMSKSEAMAKEAIARGLYAETEALKVYNTAYASLLDYKQKMLPFTEKEIAAAAISLATRMKEKGELYQYTDELAAMSTELAAVGLTANDAERFLERLQAATALPQEAPKTVEVLARQYEKLAKMLGISDEKAKALAASMVSIAQSFGGETADKIPAALQSFAEEMAGIGSKSLVSSDSAIAYAVMDGQSTGKNYTEAEKRFRESIRKDIGFDLDKALLEGGGAAKRNGLAAQVRAAEDMGLNIIQAKQGNIGGPDYIPHLEKELESLMKTIVMLAGQAKSAEEGMAKVQEAWAKGEKPEADIDAHKGFAERVDGLRAQKVSMLNNPSLSAAERYAFMSQTSAAEIGATADLRKYTLDTTLKGDLTREDLARGTPWKIGISGTPDEQADKMAKLIAARDALKDENGLIKEGQEGAFAKAKDDVTEYAEAMNRAAGAGKQLGEALKQIRDLGVDLAVTAIGDSFYAMGQNLHEAGSGADEWEDNMRNLTKTMLNSLPTLFLQLAVQATSAGNWELGLAFLAMAGVSGIGAGWMNSRETDKPEEDNNLKLLQNLQEQFRIMIEQFQASILYLEVARQKYIGDAQVAGVSAYADGDVFQGSTGLKQGVYSQPTFFRFANGGQFSGVLGEAGAEAVMPLTRLPNGKLGVGTTGGNGGISVVVQNYANATVSDVQETTGTDGGRQLLITIEKAVNGLAAQGKFDGSFGGRYGMTPKATRRS